MGVINLSLLLGGGLFMAVPIVLHLIMRQQPKQYVFPALRFVRQRKETNTRRMQLRHWLLLALRCLAIGILAACLARPSVASTAFGNWLLVAFVGALAAITGVLAIATYWQQRGWAMLAGLGSATGVLMVLFLYLFGSTWSSASAPILGDRKAPAAAALVIDTAPRMQYKFENQTRLEAAQALAGWLLKQLPEESELAVLDARPGSTAFGVDRAAATQSLERLQITGAPVPLATALREAIALVSKSEKPRKEVYLFTDLTAAAWDATAARGLAEELATASQVLVYVIDVGALEPQDFALGELRLSSETLAQSSQLEISTEIRRLGPTGDRAVELLVEEPDPTRPIIVDGKPLLPEMKVRSRQTVHLEAGSAQGLTFQLNKLPLGVHQGQLRIIGEDGLAADDVRYFTVAVQPAWRVLVVAPRGVSPTLMVEAIAPYEFRQTGQARFDTVAIAQADLANQRLEEFAAVLLLDPSALVPTQWEQLTSYAQRGGGVGVFLGHEADVPSFSSAEALKLLPGKLGLQTRAPDGVWLDPRSLDHPLLAPFRSLGTQVPWRSFPVFRYWALKDLAPDARAVINYSDGRPALLERSIGRGRCLVLTTPVSDPLQPRGRAAWNELPSGENAWPFFILANEMVGHLVSSGETRLNYFAGDTAVLLNQSERDPERYQLFTPSDDPYDVAARDGRVTIKFTDLPGAYRLKGQFNNQPVVRGFSVNLPETATELTRITREELDERLGKGRYQYARTQAEIVLGGEDRTGREFYPLLALGLALILALEHVLSNRFYRPEGKAAAAVGA
ncbi:MAG TPA: BatA domain-containing protein [Pirellulaceae bacterium]|nr:BatA domain-containing protein [Pirellulaceae bacterium]